MDKVRVSSMLSSDKVSCNDLRNFLQENIEVVNLGRKYSCGLYFKNTEQMIEDKINKEYKDDINFMK